MPEKIRQKRDEFDAKRVRRALLNNKGMQLNKDLKKIIIIMPQKGEEKKRNKFKENSNKLE